jgi:transcriptional regulator with XRE-family HTH domain
MARMATRERPGDRAATEARHLVAVALTEIRTTRRHLTMSMEAAAKRAGMSPSQYHRLESSSLAEPSIEQVCRAARAVGLRPYLRLYPQDEAVRDAPQLKLLDRFAAVLAPPIRIQREVTLPIAGDRRAWDARIHDGVRVASIEAETRLDDLQAVARRIAAKQRDDPDAGVVILLLNRTAHNRRALAVHREALRAQFPLDGAAVLRDLRAGRIPVASGIVLA